MDNLSLNCLFACAGSTASPSRVGVAVVTIIAVGSSLAVIAAFVYSRALRRWQVIVPLAIVSGIVAMLFPAVQSAREQARRSSCDCNLKQIGLGLQCYADVYKSFPPAYITDEKGNRMHSWRVLILPFLDQVPLYKRYDFNEPWNGPHNRQLSKMMPKFFRCPSDDVSRPGETSYAAIDGPGTVFAANRGSKFGEIPDGTSNTLSVVEAVGAGIDWLEPRDVPFSTLKAGLMSPTKGGIASRHDSVCGAAFCDGHTSGLKSTISPKTLQALATRAGGEQITGDF